MNARDQLLTRGFAVSDDTLSQEQLAQARAVVDRENEHLTARDGARYFVNLTARDAMFRSLVVEAPFLSLAESLLGVDCIISGSCARTALPGCQAQRPHRDQWDWWPSMPWLPEVLAVTMVWPLDDFRDENGATRVVAGTHLEPSPRVDGPDEPLEVPAGSCIAFDQRLIHRGGANRTDRPRRALFVTYLRSWLKPHTDHRRATDAEVVAEASPVLLRLLGFQRQSSIDLADGRSLIVEARGATNFYGVPSEGSRT